MPTLTLQAAVACQEGKSNSRPKNRYVWKGRMCLRKPCTLEDKLDIKCGAVAPNTDGSHYAPSVPYNRMA